MSGALSRRAWSRTGRCLTVILWLGLACGLLGPVALAQRATHPGRFALGAQIGKPTGLTFKLYLEQDIALDLMAAWGFDRSLLANFHASYEYAIPESPLGFFLGPGFLIGRDIRSNDARLLLGLSAQFGLNYFTQRFEVFLQARPSMELLPQSIVRIGGSAGLRYYF
ncbi:MAG: hypothetical protein R2834_08500 [Rhodothermales bacterium]